MTFVLVYLGYALGFATGRAGRIAYIREGTLMPERTPRRRLFDRVVESMSVLSIVVALVFAWSLQESRNDLIDARQDLTSGYQSAERAARQADAAARSSRRAIGSAEAAIDRNERLSACVARYNQRFQATYRTRVAITGTRNDALDNIVNAVASGDREQMRDAVRHYRAIIRRIERQRANNPYPPLPSTLCNIQAKPR